MHYLCIIDASCLLCRVTMWAVRAPGEFVHLMHQCWSQDPAQRPEFTAITGQLWELCESLGVNAESMVCSLDDQLLVQRQQEEYSNADGRKDTQWVQLQSSLLQNPM